jgi:hypothetical protein
MSKKIPNLITYFLEDDTVSFETIDCVSADEDRLIKQGLEKLCGHFNHNSLLLIFKSLIADENSNN